jgi:hypothetical protein
MADRADKKEIPQLVTELIEMSTGYVKQEAWEPLKRLGRQAGFGLLGGVILAVAALYLGLATYAAWGQILPEGEWWKVAARGLTVVVTGAGAGLIMWRATR